MRSRIVNRACFFSLLLLLCTAAAVGQNIDIDSLEAEEEFGWGVRAYHRGYFQDAISTFNSALSLVPENELIREWIGRAYFRSGLEQAAVDEWSGIVERGAGSLYIEEMVEHLSRRRTIGPDAVATEPYIHAREFEGLRGERTVFRRPTAVHSRADGSMLVVSFGGHEISVLDVNGARIGRWGGGAVGFDAPYDIVESGGSYYVTEFAADRISRLNTNGGREETFGESGMGEGELMGPQYIVADGKGYLYVTDWGNRRISKFSEEGEFILDFGSEETGDFPGFRGPTGIVHLRDAVYVADAEHGSIFAFDESGNYLETLGEGRLEGVEGLSVFSDRELLVSRRDHLQVLDLDLETLRTLSDIEGAGERIVSAVRDTNGDVVATDFDANRLYVLSERPSLYTGLRTHIERVDSDFFPEIIVDVRIEDRNGNPIVGLRRNNFVITEESEAVDDVELLYAADRDANPQVSLLVGRNPEFAERTGTIEDIASEIHEIVTGSGDIRLVTSGAEPAVELPAGRGQATFSDRAAHAGSYDGESRFDTSVRLAAGELMRSRGRRSVTYLTDGRLPDGAFDTYDLEEVAAHLRNNGIRFDLLLVNNSEADAELEYLVAETSGVLIRPEEPRALLPYAEVIADRPSGRYVLRYRTLKDGDFGRRYLPLEIEAALGRRTGRGESGYFAPFED